MKNPKIKRFVAYFTGFGIMRSRRRVLYYPSKRAAWRAHPTADLIVRARRPSEMAGAK